MAYSRDELKQMWIHAGGPAQYAEAAADYAMQRTGGNPAYSQTVGGNTYKGAWGLPEYLAATNDPIQQARMATGVTYGGTDMSALGGDPGLPYDWLTNLIGIDKLGRTIMFGGYAVVGFIVMCFGFYFVFFRDYVKSSTRTILGLVSGVPMGGTVQGAPAPARATPPPAAAPAAVPAPPPGPGPRAGTRPLAPTREYPTVPAREVRPSWYTGPTTHLQPVSQGGPAPRPRPVRASGRHSLEERFFPEGSFR